MIAFILQWNKETCDCESKSKQKLNINREQEIIFELKDYEENSWN